MQEENTNDQGNFRAAGPLDAQIAALKGNGNDMDALTAHASN